MNWAILLCCLGGTLFVGDKSNLLPVLVIMPIAVTLIKQIAVKADIFSPPVFFSSFFLLFMGVGYTICFNQNYFGRHPVYSQIAFLILLAYFCWLIGFSLPRLKIFSPPVHSVTPPVKIDAAYRRTMYLSLAITIVGLSALTIFYLGGAFRILISGMAEESRYMMTFGRGYLYYLGNSINISIPIYIGSKLYYKKKLQFFDFGIIVFSLLFISLSLSRSNMLWYLVSFIIIYHYLIKKIPYFRAFYCAGILFIIAVSILYLRFPGAKIKVLFLNELSVHIKNIGLYLLNSKKLGYLGLFPLKTNLSMLLPGHQPDFGLWLKSELGLTFPGGGISIPW